MDNKITIITAVTVAFVAGAGAMFLLGKSGGGSSQTSDSDKQKAQQKLNAMIRSKNDRLSAEKAREEAAEAERQRLAEEAARPKYSRPRMDRARVLKQWADVTIPDYNIKGWLKTWWTDGNMHLRLALLGNREALSVFTSSWPKLRLTFADQSGTNVYEVMVNSQDLSWDNSPRNSGVPTMQLESTIDCPLEAYEAAVQWNLKWEI